MVDKAKKIIGSVRRSPMALLGVTLIFGGAMEIARLLPMDAAFSPTSSWIDFFEMPIVQFYPVLALAAVEGARRIGILAPLFFLLTLGVISACDRTTLHPSASRVFHGFLIELQIAVFIFALYRLDIITTSASVITALAFPLLYGILLTMIRKINSHPRTYGA